MPPAGDPSDKPDYKVYRSRRGVLGGIRKPELSKPSRPKLGKPRRKRDEPRIQRSGDRSWFRWALYAAGGWLLLSLVIFGISAAIQKYKLPDSAGDAVSGKPGMLIAGQNVLIMGTDARPEGSKEAGAVTVGSRNCPNVAKCKNVRADTLMVVHAGGGKFRKLSIPRDSFAEIPGNGATKINAANSFGGPALQVKTVENFLDIEIDHVEVVDFDGFKNLIDALGGIKVRLRKRVCAEVNGGGKNGGVTLRLTGGEHTLDGRQALALARARQNTCDRSFDDVDRAENQQRVISGIQERMTSPLRLPYNFIKGPFIAWTAPQTMIGDMGPITLPQLVLSSAVGGDSKPLVLKPSGSGPGGSIIISEDERQKKVRKLQK